MKDDPFKNMSDEQLVSMVNDPFARSSNDGPVHAELYRRKKIGNMKSHSIQKQIRNMTIIILIIAAVTLFFTMLPFCEKFFKLPLSPQNMKPHTEYNQPANPNYGEKNLLPPRKTEK